MSRSDLRWWLWTCFTFAVIGIAGMFGFFGVLLRNDVTFLGFVVIGLYVLTTVWMIRKVRSGARSYEFVWYLAECMERAGLLGTFIGLAIAFQALAGMASGGTDWKQSLITGIMTKFYASIVGLVAALMLKTQIKILETGHDT